jgi:hypothetical protein
MSVAMMTDTGLLELEGHFCGDEMKRPGVFHLVRGGRTGSTKFGTIPPRIDNTHPVAAASIGDTYSYVIDGTLLSYEYFGLFTVDHFDVDQETGDVTRVIRSATEEPGDE